MCTLGTAPPHRPSSLSVFLVCSGHGMASLQQDILGCLAAINTGGGSSGAAHGAAGGAGVFPLAWLLLDLEQLLPPNSSLASKLRSDELQLCKELDMANRSSERAARRAAALLDRSRQLQHAAAGRPALPHHRHAQPVRCSAGDPWHQGGWRCRPHMPSHVGSV